MIKVRHSVHIDAVTKTGRPKTRSEYVGFAAIAGDSKDDPSTDYTYPTYWVYPDTVFAYLEDYLAFSRYKENNPTKFNLMASFRNANSGAMLHVYRKSPSTSNNSPYRVYANNNIPPSRLCRCCGIYQNGTLSGFNKCMVMKKRLLYVEKVVNLPKELLDILPLITEFYWVDNGIVFFIYKDTVVQFANSEKSFNRYWGREALSKENVSTVLEFCLRSLHEWIDSNLASKDDSTK